MMKKILVIFICNLIIANISEAGTLVYSTFLGGSNDDYSTAIAQDTAGYIYITGQTSSTDFPTTSTSYDTSFNGGSYDAFVTKFTPDLSTLLYSTLIGGNAADGSAGLVVDTQGDVYITGYTFSTTFPTTSSAYQKNNNGGSDVFVSKLSPTGDSLIYSTLLGGSGNDYSYGIALDSNENVYITGYAGSVNFPSTPNAYQTTNISGESVFVTKLNQTGSNLIYSTFLEGNDLCQGNGIAVDSTGNAYITGQTYATNFPITHGALDTSFNGNEDAFITKLNPTGSSLVYSTFLGGSGNSVGAAIAVDTSGNAYVTGNTSSPNFPIVRGSFDTSNNGGRDVFVTELNSSGTTLIFSTLLGGKGDDYGNAITLDSANNIYITGITQSSNFPVTSGTNDTTFHEGLNDVFFSKLNPSGSSLLYSTYLGGSDDDEGYGVLVNSSGDVYITGITNSPNFPVTFGAYNTTLSGGYDVFVCKYNPNISAPVLSTVPSLKLFVGQSLSNAINLEYYNSGGSGTVFSTPVNFITLSSLSGSTVSQSSYNAATTGINVYKDLNALGSSTASNKVKYSTYKIDKLPIIGLTAGSSWELNLTNYMSNVLGPIIPPSFGNPSSIIMSNPSIVTATWIDSTVIRIQSLQSFSGPVYVDVIASPVSAPPYGKDIDKEQIAVYNNLLSQSTFSTANDTTAYGLEIPPGRTVMAISSWLSTYTDAAGIPASGVWQFTFPNASGGIKGTPQLFNWIPMTTNQWYTMRMRVVASGSNAHQSFLYGFNNIVTPSEQTDASANIWFGIPTIWTWQETPLLVHSNSETGYLQFQFKASTAGNIYIDELQIINSAPTLVYANRNNTRLFYPYGDFNVSLDTVGWGQEIYFGASTSPEISVSNNTLILDFAGAGSGLNQKGIKWTANNGHGNEAATFAVTPGREVGARATFTVESGVFNSLGIVLVSTYGVQSSGQQEIGIAPSNLMASAGIGVLLSGTYRAVAQAINPYYQFQFGARSDEPGLLAVSNVDFDRDQDDPDYGDPTLYP